MFSNVASAEGTKQLMPSSSNYGCIQVNDVSRPFALMTNTDPLHRLYFRISSTTEKAYFGFSKHSSSVASSGQFRIKNPSGTIVYAATNIPTSGNGNISSHSEALAGPKISGSPAGGYNPLSYTPVTTGDFYIEFSSSSNENYRFEFFDLTVVNASNVPINGRLWSYAWDLNTWAASNSFSGSFYVYTNEGFVSRVNMNGIQPFGFVTSCNGTGPQNTGNLIVDRRSIDGNSTRPDFKVFLNDPDITVYPSASTPSITSPVQIVGGNIHYGSPVQFAVGVSAPGTMQFIISINGVSGYQAGTTDVIVVANVVAGDNTINWDGKDAFGNYPAAGSTIEISSGFSGGITHLPIYDPETHSSGFIIDRIRPGTGSAPIRWDDTNFGGGTFNISAGSGNGHSWSSNFGNTRTMNTWWNGYEVENQDQFTVIVLTPLPIELTAFMLELNNDEHPELSWITSSETNLDYFILEKSASPGDGVPFIKAGTMNAAGNSSVVNCYSFVDNQPLTGYSYYRLKAVTYDGHIAYTSQLKMTYTETGGIEVFPNPVRNELNIANEKLKIQEIWISNAHGKIVFQSQAFSQDAQISIDVSQLNSGKYFVKALKDNNVYVKTIAVQ